MSAGSPDHPRACGANCRCCSMFCTVSGSSPRMRGKLITAPVLSSAIRIIPAHAGQTFVIGARGLGKTDHPRACGANAAAGRIRTLRRGSSPRMRGKQGGRRKLEREIRIIPAHAGQTRALARPDQRRTDHPRACGANLIVFGVVHTHLGSSPRMRGKLARPCTSSADLRIIPAHAGQTRGQRI